MAITSVEPNSSAQLTLKPMPLLPGVTFTFHNALNVTVTITSQGKDVQIKEAS
ncbi:MAG: hypothetical protein ACE5KI_05860 [Dehalococcoidia bacterium]